jgi:hypothetical protein
MASCLDFIANKSFPSKPNGTTYWRVRARDAAGNFGAASTPRTLTIALP